MEKLPHSSLLPPRARELKNVPCQDCRYTNRNNKRAQRTTSLNPPPEKSAATSGMWVVPPTVVTLNARINPKKSQFQIHEGDMKGQRAVLTNLQWATRRETCNESSPVRAVVRDANLRRRVGVTISNTAIPRAEQYRSSPCT